MYFMINLPVYLNLPYLLLILEFFYLITAINRIAPPQNSHVEALTHNAMFLEMRPLGGDAV